jgi:hypothetical protein
MNHLPHLVELLVDTRFGSVQTLLSQVDGVREQGAAFADAAGITAFLQLDAFVFQEAFEVLEQFVMIKWFHKNSRS